MEMDWSHIIETIGTVILAISAIITAILRIVKPMQKLSENVTELKKANDELMIVNAHRREEGTVLIKGLRATLDGLMQQGCNGSVAKASRELDEYIDTITEERR